MSAHPPSKPWGRAEKARASAGHQLTPPRAIQPNGPPASCLGAPRGREEEGPGLDRLVWFPGVTPESAEEACPAWGGGVVSWHVRAQVSWGRDVLGCQGAGVPDRGDLGGS